jgi:hypothetical protein
MDVRQFWGDVKQRLEEITPKYPSGVVHLVSRHNREKNTTAGTICTANLVHAAECLVNNTHDLATPDQIQAYEHQQARKKQGIVQAEVAKKQQFVMVMDKEEAQARGIPTPDDAAVMPPSTETQKRTDRAKQPVA